VDEMYRANIKPWNSYGWRPHLFEREDAPCHEKDTIAKSGSVDVREVNEKKEVKSA